MQTNRLTVIGEISQFERSAWLPAVGGRHYELLVLTTNRYVCQFETLTSPLPGLQQLSRLYPGLVLLLEYETGRAMGLAVIKAGVLDDHCVVY